jgi:hypothetical protein
MNCVQTLIAIRDNPNFPPITRIAACNSLLDRGYGRPVQGVAFTNLTPLPDPKQITPQMSMQEARQLYADSIKQAEHELLEGPDERPIIDVTPADGQS